ncbi:calcium-activated chloride channel regulator 4, 30 kda form [Plakobranchus ocellatus]|uniref:Calcium-activated chloride channel regulator 4, 30 kDa form n=1 Tax=Plakobranchus ocellatus TaxID=259542 RepID=A0AAV4DH55_9GAST|nr:calcium-activated chloride channel regulator 4, 30 kda form [Plakobranchus ocellatus]
MPHPQTFLTATSAALFKATRNQLYFREFIIVIPEEWQSKQTYENALDVELDRAQLIIDRWVGPISELDRAKLIIDRNRWVRSISELDGAQLTIDRSNPAYGDAPYVKQYAECGSPGLYIHLTPGYLLDDAVVRKWGKPEKTLVHEWAHLRWGLFDEYPIDAQDDAFYRYAGLWQPTRCSVEVEGSILNEFTNRPCQFDFFTGKPEANCRFFPRMAANKAASSIMFMQYLESITEFCDNAATAPKHLRHNYLAPNRQNRLCYYKSAWEVMKKHKDFAKIKKPLPEDTDTRPKFRYVQAHPRKRVLVLDTSGSMTGASLNVLKQAASNYILSCIETGSKLGIVQFNTNASALSQLVEVNNEKDRFSLIDALPKRAMGKTSIGSGLQKAVEVLTKTGDAPGGSIVLITDGKENEGPYLKDLRPALMKQVKKPLPEDTDTRPKFRYVQAHPRKRVLVLDTSGSMTASHGVSLNVLKQAASNYILSCIETGSKLGIVQFNTNASALSQLVEVNNEKDRFSLIDALPKRAMGKTSIGSGLQKAVEVLTKTGDAPGGSIVLITDGKENEGPYLKDLRPALMKQGIVVHALAYGQRAEQSIAELSQETGGKTFFYSGRHNSTALIDGLAATVATENSVISRAGIPHSILTDAGIVWKSAALHGHFYIDSTVGKDTSLTFSYSSHIQVKVQGPAPSFEIYTDDKNKKLFRYNTMSRMLKIIIHGVAKAGKWTYHVTTNATKSHITVNIQSKPSEKGADVLQVNSWIPDQGEIWFNPKQKFGIYAEVVRGKAPVLGAEVIATIERPQSSPIDLHLHDNGVGFDIIKGDGVYAASIIARDLLGNGRYNIKVHATGIKGSTKVVTARTGLASRALNVEESGQLSSVETRDVEQFQRVSSAGEFRLRGFPPASAVAQNSNGSSQSETNIDEMPPSRITDLHVTSFDWSTFTASLEWTAVGDDMERGKASKYRIFIADDFAKLILEDEEDTANKENKDARSDVYVILQEHVLKGSLYAPQEAGQTERFVLGLNPNMISVTNALKENRTVFLSIQAVDSAGNVGDMSNVVSLSKAEEVAIPRIPLSKDTLPLGLYLAVLLPAAFILLVLLLIIAALVVHRARKIKSKNIDQDNDWLSVNMAHMNYMFEGEYRKRSQEDLDNWSKGSK